MRQRTITYLCPHTNLNHTITCSQEWSLAGYVWRTTNEIPNYPGCLTEKTLEELETTVKLTIDRWSET